MSERSLLFYYTVPEHSLLLQPFDIYSRGKLRELPFLLMTTL